MTYHIAWFNEAPVRPQAEGGLTSDNDTVCRRCLVPARALERFGIECSVFGNLEDADPAEVTIQLQKLQAEIVVIGKFALSSSLAMARAAKHLGCYVVADIDADSVASSDFPRLAELADHLVAASLDVARAVQKRTGHTPSVIPDCDEDDDGAQSPLEIAKLWLDDFRRLHLKPPACANTNEPLRH